MAPTPVEVVAKLLANTNDVEIVNSLVTPDADYISLTYLNPDLQRILPWAGSHRGAGPQAIIDTFRGVHEFWERESFDMLALFGSGENVSAMGTFTLRSRTLNKVFTSPFSIWCKVNEHGKVTFMQYMEDTVGTTSVFVESGKRTYRADPKGGSFEV